MLCVRAIWIVYIYIVSVGLPSKSWLSTATDLCHFLCIRVLH